MKRRMLFISMSLPYAKVAHAGGKTFHYYINSFAKDDENEVTLIAKVLPSEKGYVDDWNKEIRLLTVATPENKLKRYWSYLLSLNSKLNPWYKYGNTLTKEIYNQIRKQLFTLKQEGYIPEIIILEWTEMLLFVNEVKKIYPHARYVASEHDVSFLRIEREMLGAGNWVKKYYKKISYETIKRQELNAIRTCDLVVTHNWKDYMLLKNNGVDTNKLGVISPYYDKFPVYAKQPDCKDILYYGAMNRAENSNAAIWFIKNVMPRLSDCDIRFVVVGNKPPRELLDLQSDRIIVTGYVEDVVSYFAGAICLVAPLLLGAGIKVKIIEALSAGIPVLTNDIGIEGIDAENGVHYFHCIEPFDYEAVIRRLVQKEIDIETVASCTRKLIDEKYNLQESFEGYSERVYTLLK